MSALQPLPTSSSPKSRSGPSKTYSSIFKLAAHHVKRHVGVGVVCAVAYFDPGNWSVDLQAGAQFGYRPMLFVLLISGLGAMVLQTLACRLGCVTGIDLASHCRLLLHDTPRHPVLVRRLVMYPLYIFAEIAIISTDLAEVLGSAIGICLIFPSLPLWAGVILTALDVLVFLLFSDPSRGQGRPVRIFEFIIITLVFAVFACFIVLLIRVHPHWPGVFLGYIPDKNLFKTRPNAIYAAVGILGATIMPHALFLGSFLATQDRIALQDLQSSSDLPGPSDRKQLSGRFKTYFIGLFRITPAERAAAARDYRSKYGARENNSLSFVKQHLNHVVFDVCSSLLALAVPINSAILILSATVFFGRIQTDIDGPIIGLFDAHALIRARIGPGSAFVFALALVAAGQTSSITATLAGQVVGEGFIEWRMSPFLRRLITRLISLVPSVVVAVAVGRDGIDNLLVISQVVLSVVLPFVAFPLIYLTSSKVVMRVRKPSHPEPSAAPFDEKPIAHATEDVAPESEDPDPGVRGVVEESIPPPSPISTHDGSEVATQEFPIEETADHADAISMDNSEFIDYSNGRIMTTLAYAIWTVILIANAYTIVVLGLDQS